jgi:hypothetical protein
MHGKTATATVRSDRAEDALEAHAFTCTGDYRFQGNRRVPLAGAGVSRSARARRG